MVETFAETFPRTLPRIAQHDITITEYTKSYKTVRNFLIVTECVLDLVNNKSIKMISKKPRDNKNKRKKTHHKHITTTESTKGYKTAQNFPMLFQILVNNKSTNMHD